MRQSHCQADHQHNDPRCICQATETLSVDCEFCREPANSVCAECELPLCEDHRRALSAGRYFCETCFYDHCTGAYLTPARRGIAVERNMTALLDAEPDFLSNPAARDAFTSLIDTQVRLTDQAVRLARLALEVA